MLFVVCQWPNVPSLGSIDLAEYEIHQNCVMRLRSNGLDLPCEKRFGVRDNSFKLMLNGCSRLGVVVWDG